MYTGNTISLKSILWKVKTFPNMTELLYEDAVMYAAQALKLLQTPLIYIDKVSNPIKIVNNKAALPDNVVNVKGLRIINDLNNYENQAFPLTYSTNTFQGSTNCIDENNCPTEFTYTIQSGVIKTSFKDGYVQVAYQSLPVDEEGYPLIPDNEKVILAIEYFIRYSHLEPLWEIGKITDKVFNRIEQRKCWYMGAAQTSTLIANIDHVETIFNTINRLLIGNHGHKVSFRNAGTKEVLKKYN